MQYAGQEPFSLLAHKLCVIVCSPAAAQFQLGIGYGKRILSTTISERHVDMSYRGSQHILFTECEVTDPLQPGSYSTHRIR